MNLELGGGSYARGAGWVNLDKCDGADIRHDLDSTPWPLGDDSVSAVYSSHCLEHLRNPFLAFAEICRVCALGAPVEIRTPHPHSHLAMTAGHIHVFSPLQAENMERHFPRDFWKDQKRMRLDRIEYAPTFLLDQAKAELPFLRGLSDEVVMRWVPGACHECRFFYTVIENEYRPLADG